MARHSRIAEPPPRANLPERRAPIESIADELADLAANATSESVRVSALRALAELTEKDRAREDEAEAQAPEDDVLAAVSAEYADLDDGAFDIEYDEWLAMTLREVVIDGADFEGAKVRSRYPRSAEVALEAIGHEAAVEARRIADADRIEAEIEEKAEERAGRLFDAHRAMLEAEFAAKAKADDDAVESSFEAQERAAPLRVTQPEGIDPRAGWPRLLPPGRLM